MTQTPDLAVPEFAVLGHPNEGKSSVVSTLTEDDRIGISSVPGETKVSRAYTVNIDHREIIRFVDTPGFQMPRQTLAWFKAHPGADLIDRFIAAHAQDPFFADECELLTPLAKGVGIIYVVDGSRPVREDDLAEMEILRLTGRPRMAVINSKTAGRDYTDQWKQEFRQHFNVIRIFNSNTADFYERIRMLESLKAIDQDWENGLAHVVSAFKAEWEKRNRMACAHITYGIEQALAFSVSGKLTSKTDPATLKEKLVIDYQSKIRKMETRMFERIRSLYRHRHFDYKLPEYSALHHDLFSERTWEILGLTRGQLATVGAVLGGTFGAVLDTAAAGLTFGVFTAIGSAIGAGSALAGAKKLSQSGAEAIGGDRIRVGPNENIQFLYILLDRAVLYYTQMVRHPHGRRDLPVTPVAAAGPGGKDGKQGISATLTREQHKVCTRFFKNAQGKGMIPDKKIGPEFALLVGHLLKNN
ncbi:MAG: hypothetical protein CSA29_04485 [Desulfobacterales bacterium]|nr:MAG: hypothetical protein CSA29_04485 [Desulfobacterales bacterium]